jgi:hypothetical protein
MKTRFSVISSALIAVFVLLPSMAFAWGWAVHCYIDDQFKTKWQIRNANQLYGGFAPDMFLYRYDTPEYLQYLFEQTHYNFMDVWNAAKSVPAKAAAFGFVSHNEEWGIDSTAHIASRTLDSDKGYVIIKAIKLAEDLQNIPGFAALQLPDEVVVAIAHEFVEYGVDILMKNLDPRLGAKIVRAAAPPNPNIPLVVEQAFVRGFAEEFGLRLADARKYFKSSERQFRQIMILYGQALMEDDETAIEILAEHLAEIATAFLTVYGITLPEGVDITALAQFGISQAMILCADDFAGEVFATSFFVRDQLIAHGISY